MLMSFRVSPCIQTCSVVAFTGAAAELGALEPPAADVAGCDAAAGDELAAGAAELAAGEPAADGVLELEPPAVVLLEPQAVAVIRATAVRAATTFSAGRAVFIGFSSISAGGSGSMVREVSLSNATNGETSRASFRRRPVLTDPGGLFT